MFLLREEASRRGLEAHVEDGLGVGEEVRGGHLQLKGGFDPSHTEGLHRGQVQKLGTLKALQLHGGQTQLVGLVALVAHTDDTDGEHIALTGGAPLRARAVRLSPCTRNHRAHHYVVNESGCCFTSTTLSPLEF